jgi:hypothetical protein
MNGLSPSPHLKIGSNAHMIFFWDENARMIWGDNITPNYGQIKITIPTVLQHRHPLHAVTLSPCRVPTGLALPQSHALASQQPIHSNNCKEGFHNHRPTLGHRRCADWTHCFKPEFSLHLVDNHPTVFPWTPGWTSNIMGMAELTQCEISQQTICLLPLKSDHTVQLLQVFDILALCDNLTWCVMEQLFFCLLWGPLLNCTIWKLETEAYILHV